MLVEEVEAGEACCRAGEMAARWRAMSAQMLSICFVVRSLLTLKGRLIIPTLAGRPGSLLHSANSADILVRPSYPRMAPNQHSSLVGTPSWLFFYAESHNIQQPFKGDGPVLLGQLLERLSNLCRQERKDGAWAFQQADEDGRI